MKKLLMFVLGGILAAVMPLIAETEIVGNIEWTYEQDWDWSTDRLLGVSVTGAQSTETETYTYYRYGYPYTGTRRKTLSGSVTIPSRLGGYPVTRIRKYTFNVSMFGWSLVTDVKIPDSVTRLEAGAFIAQDDTNDAYIDTETMPGLKLVDGWVVGYSDSLPETLDLTGARGVASGAFSDCANPVSVTIPSGVTRIWDGAFDRFRGLKSVTIPGSVTSIGRYAFLGCRSLTGVIIPDGVQQIESMAFGSSGLTSVAFPSSMKSIGSYAFEYCDRLASIIVPSSVTNIGRLAFGECESLKTITLPKWCKNLKMYYDGDEWQRLKGGKSSLGRTLRDGEYIADFVYYLFADDTDGEDYASVKKRIKITYKDVKGGAGGGAVPEAWQKARTLKGKATRALANPVVGIFELKCGKASKQGVAKVSATLTGLDGKKKSYKAQSVDVTGKAANVNFDGLSVAIDGDSFSGGEGLPGGLSVSAANVGGDWTRDGAKVYVDATGADLPAGTVAELLPDGEPVIAKGGKWAFNKAAGVKLSKDKTSAERDTSKGKTNLSGLKLTYTPKTGLFKGSFKVYALEGADGAKKLKKYTVAVTGVVVDGKGVGQAAIKRPAAGPWAVAVE